MARPRSVLTPPPPPRPSRKKPARQDASGWTPRPGLAFRVRPTAESPFGGFGPSRYTDDENEADRWQAENEANGIESIVEEGIQAGYRPRRLHEPVTVADLASEGLAREVTATIRKPDGTTRDDTRWEITPEGQQRLLDGMRP